MNKSRSPLGQGEKHTPGPWYVYIGEDREAIAVQKFVEGDSGGTAGKSIARMPIPHNWGHKNSRNTQEEIDANARLIAAAPDLLEALTHLLATMSVTDEEGLLEFAEPVAKARAAILKATSSSSPKGGSP